MDKLKLSLWGDPETLNDLHRDIEYQEEVDPNIIIEDPFYIELVVEYDDDK